MNFFITGATGIIDGYLVEKLAAGHGHIYVLIHESSRHKFHALKARIGASDAERVIPVYGNIAAPGLDLSASDMAVLRGNVDHFLYFTAASTTITAGPHSIAANQSNMANALQAAELMHAAGFHHICSTGLSDLFKGLIQESSPEETLFSVHSDRHNYLSH